MDNILNKINKGLNNILLNETKAEDELYFEGVFWIIADSFEDILNGNYKIITKKLLVDYQGELKQVFDGTNWTHEQIWDKLFKSTYENKSFDYYPRGRIVVKNGSYWINLPSEIYLPDIIDGLTAEFCLSKLNRKTSIKRSSSGDHYHFELK